MMLCLTIVIGTLLEDCLIHPMEQREEAQDQAKTRPFGGGMSILWDESGVASPHLPDVQKIRSLLPVFGCF